MKAIIDCSSDTINSFLNGCPPNTRASPRKRISDEDRNPHLPHKHGSLEEGGGVEVEDTEVSSGKPTLVAKASQELEWNKEVMPDSSGGSSSSQVFGEFQTFPDLVGVWSNPPSVMKSFSHSSCLLSSCRRENQCELTPSHSCTEVEKMSKVLSDTALAIRKRLNLLSIITSANGSRSEGLDSCVFTHSNQCSHVEAILCELSESLQGRDRSRKSGQGSSTTSEMSMLNDKSLGYILAKKQATEKTSSTNANSKSPPMGALGVLQEEPSPTSSEKDYKRNSSCRTQVNKTTNTSPRETHRQSDTSLFLARAPMANRIKTATKERKAHSVKKPSAGKVSYLNRACQHHSFVCSGDRRELAAENAADPTTRRSLPEAEESAERVYRDLRANSSGRVKVRLMCCYPKVINFVAISH